jgi:hypothetical protein
MFRKDPTCHNPDLLKNDIDFSNKPITEALTFQDPFARFS